MLLKKGFESTEKLASVILAPQLTARMPPSSRTYSG
jgi:hypothetical protein